MEEKEAKDRIKVRFDKWALDDEDLEALQTLVPELAESEDERIRKAMVDYFSQYKDDGLRGVDITPWIAYLEKQKEQSITDNDLDEEINRFFDDCIDVHEAKLYGNISERVIPVDCYEITARHFAKWGEKQKEQKPNIELIQRSWYMEGYNDRKFGNEPKWIIKTGEGGPRHELNPRYGQPLADEQKPTEEQLHNLNEAIKGLRMDGCEHMADSLHSLYNILRRNKEQKPVESISRLTIQGKGVYKICPRCKERMVRDDSKVYTSMPPQYGYNCPKCGTMEFDTVMYDNPEMEEQKPVEFNDNDDQLIGFIFDLLNALVWRKDWAMSKEECLERLKSLHPQPKQEWSKEDEKILEQVIDVVYAYCPDPVAKYKLKDWLTQLLKSLRPRPSWRPSEEQIASVMIASECVYTEADKKALESLYHDLKKLM